MSPLKSHLHSLTAAVLAAGAIARADIYVSGFNSGGVYRFDGTTGAAVGTGVFIASGSDGLSLPHGVMRLADGTFIVASAGTDEVLRYSGNGTYLSKFIENGQNGLPALTLDYPVDFAIGPGGDLFVTSQANDRVLRFNAETGAFISIFIDSVVIDGPSGLSWHPTTGDLYLAARFGNAVLRYSSAGTQIAAFTPAAFNQPFGIAIHPTTGDVYASEGGNNSIRIMDPSSGAALSTLSGSLGFPIGLRFGPGGDLYVANFSNDRITRRDGLTGTAGTDLIDAATAAAVGLDGPNYFNFIPNLTELENWRIQHFGTSVSTGDAADTSDPDHDSIPNLIEYATGSVPTNPGPFPITTALSGGYQTLTAPKAAVAGITWAAESCDDLQSWSSEGTTILTDDAEIFQARDNFMAGTAGARRFLRLKVTSP